MSSTVDEPSAADVVELALLLPIEQVEALETVAHGQGLTTAALLRQLVRNFCQQQSQFVQARNLAARFRQLADLPFAEQPVFGD